MKISELPKKVFTGEFINNCFFVDEINTTNMSSVPLRSIFDFIKSEALKDGLTVELKSDRIIFIKG